MYASIRRGIRHRIGLQPEVDARRPGGAGHAGRCGTPATYRSSAGSPAQIARSACPPPWRPPRTAARYRHGYRRNSSISLVSRMRPIMEPATERRLPNRVGTRSGRLRLVSAGKRLRSDLVGGHDPQLADGGVAGAGDHVGDAVGDVLGGEDLGLLVEGVDHLVADLGLVVGAQLGRDATGLDESDAYVPLGDFLAQRLGESVHAELGEVVYAVAVPGDAAGDRADVDDVGDPARALLGGLQQVR